MFIRQIIYCYIILFEYQLGEKKNILTYDAQKMRVALINLPPEGINQNKTNVYNSIIIPIIMFKMSTI